MKNIFFLILFYLILNQLKAQTIEAHYIVKMPMQVSVSSEKTKEIIVEYEGLIYKSGARTISYLVPQYLMQYPNGEISISTPEGVSILLLSIDTMQDVELFNTDSLRMWSCNSSSINGFKQYSTRRFERGVLTWKLLPETKVINGLQCRRAQRYSGILISDDVWVYMETPVEFGFMGITDLPGLIVEGSSPSTNISYTLKYFKQGEEIADAVFWPAIFKDVKFEELPPVIKAGNNTKKVTETNKKSDIMNQ